jgi:hypothetical protein
MPSKTQEQNADINLILKTFIEDANAEKKLKNS